RKLSSSKKSVTDPTPSSSSSSASVSPGKRPVPPSYAAVSAQPQGTFDPELRSVLELATDSELYELERILFGPSYFSPLLKSITKQTDVDYFMIEEDAEERDDFIAMLESRFLFLAADARSTLRDESGTFPSSWESSKNPDNHGSLELGLSPWKVQAIAALRVGASELRRIILKGGGMLTLGKVYNLLARKLLGRMFLEGAKYQIKKEVIRKGGQLAAVNLESRLALLVAKQGVAGAAARYLGLRSMMVLLGSMLWGTFLADVVIQMLGTDYARILRAIYAFAQSTLLSFILVLQQQWAFEWCPNSSAKAWLQLPLAC
ncbi:hypothetical protein HYC85_030493, partial [Camellia sinensis]